MTSELANVGYLISDRENMTVSTLEYVEPVYNETLDDDDFLTSRLGDRYMAQTPLVILNIIYIAIFITGLIGNVCTCIVIARNR